MDCAVKTLITRRIEHETAWIPLRFENLASKKIFNAYRVSLSIAVKSTRPVHRKGPAL